MPEVIFTESSIMGRIDPTSVVSPRVLRDQVVTVADLTAFKEDLLLSFARLLRENGQRPPKKWLKSREVRMLLGISGGTLYSMRARGTIPFTKIGNIIYYDADQVNAAIGGVQGRASDPYPPAGPEGKHKSVARLKR